MVGHPNHSTNNTANHRNGNMKMADGIKPVPPFAGGCGRIWPRVDDEQEDSLGRILDTQANVGTKKSGFLPLVWHSKDPLLLVCWITEFTVKSHLLLA